MNILPIEVQEKIWRLYWKDIYKEKIIKELQYVTEHLNKMFFFVVKEYLRKIATKQEVIEKMIFYNKIVKKVVNNKGLLLFIKGYSDFSYNSIIKIMEFKHDIDNIYMLTFVNENIYNMCIISFFYSKQQYNIITDFVNNFKNYEQITF